jgi:hypothetical protein
MTLLTHILTYTGHYSLTYWQRTLLTYRPDTHRTLLTDWPDTQDNTHILTWYTQDTTHRLTWYTQDTTHRLTWYTQDTTHILTWYTQDTTHILTWHIQDTTHWPDTNSTLLSHWPDTWTQRILLTYLPHSQDTTNTLTHTGHFSHTDTHRLAWNTFTIHILTWLKEDTTHLHTEQATLTTLRTLT